MQFARIAALQALGHDVFRAQAVDFQIPIQARWTGSKQHRHLPLARSLKDVASIHDHQLPSEMS
jgi:hypothetical protein